MPDAPDVPDVPDAPDAPDVPGAGECHLWLVPVRPRPHWLGLLDPAERLRAERLAGTPAEHVHLTSRAAQRLIGSRYLGVPPHEVTASRDCGHCGAPHGKPRWRAGEVDYSVSHTDRWLILAVTGAGPVGADIESPASITDPAALVRSALTPGEAARFHRLPAARRTAWLLRAWTRKEAAMKLTGLGLRAPPNQLDVRGPTVRAGEVPRWPHGPVHLSALAVPDGHVAALATTTPVTALRRLQLPPDR
ncbi:4'-phosphopantetheinyl transferase superfamily protein [Kitasatospora sp. NBC_01287]|uniref:4'-phosphopantetheinyl transferase family protein n=1 Tax=Kitasatospora sp. NBC_01287 TaxID=2903573 RepID=UPI00225924B4|nr:4'-phosphopantetheinyl transferase superfamily protein [Kitasatospora sp. NBC_01287]MCX4750452.1 4'-phosphopantetheinyl transferase superfamily protein [Kitasatospora sp. NBC_01287]